MKKKRFSEEQIVRMLRQAQGVVRILGNVRIHAVILHAVGVVVNVDPGVLILVVLDVAATGKRAVEKT